MYKRGALLDAENFALLFFQKINLLDSLHARICFLFSCLTIAFSFCGNDKSAVNTKKYIFTAMPGHLKISGTIYEFGALYQKCRPVRVYVARVTVTG